MPISHTAQRLIFPRTLEWNGQGRAGALKFHLKSKTPQERIHCGAKQLTNLKTIFNYF